MPEPAPAEPNVAVETPDEQATSTMVRRLALVVFLEWLGAGAIIPLFPLYLKQHGASPSLIGLTMSAFFLAGLLTQFPAGRLADRIGRRPVLIGGLILYAAACLAFILPLSAWGFIALRFVQGGAAGAVEVASLALVSSNVPIEKRGRAISRIFSAQLAGTAVGPLLGAVAGVRHMPLLFIATALACSAAAIPVLTSSTIKAHDVVHVHHQKLVRLVMSRALLGAIFGALTLGLGIGVYEACWTLLLHDRGGSSLVIALSWTAFSVPYVFFVRAAGWFADHWDRRMLAALGLLVSVGFCMAYPFVTSIPVLLAMGFIESVGFSFALPSLQAMMTEGRTPRELGRVQGVYASSQTGAIALASAVAGVLFGIHLFLPFLVSGGIGLILTAALLIAWAPLEGHAHHSPEAGD
jgi:DHA1 family multidrug resistance protein-like MFS transporter